MVGGSLPCFLRDWPDLETSAFVVHWDILCDTKIYSIDLTRNVWGQGSTLLMLESKNPEGFSVWDQKNMISYCSDFKDFSVVPWSQDHKKYIIQAVVNARYLVLYSLCEIMHLMSSGGCHVFEHTLALKTANRPTPCNIMYLEVVMSCCYVGSIINNSQPAEVWYCVEDVNWTNWYCDEFKDMSVY